MKSLDLGKTAAIREL